MNLNEWLKTCEHLSKKRIKLMVVYNVSIKDYVYICQTGLNLQSCIILLKKK